ncbi:hypothetical protein [Mycobacterium sp. E740]|uniref:hypothetical protein n=1 Tax=Mycobacterium sp. E740 TaxID=1834149 RepID=UPI0007FDE93A|nr:hypothetical protein [Mycobacterium sp. E740]OBI81965.1 hypothetical protein A5663_15265 [Mycobacterium sp. E740]
MPVAVDIRRARRLAAALASVAAVSLILMSSAGQSASAQPVDDTTYPSETAYAPAQEAPAESPAYEAPVQVPTAAAPVQVPTPEAPAQIPTPEAPVTTEQTQAPVVTTTLAPQVSAEPQPATTTQTAPQPTPTTQATTQSTTAPTTTGSAALTMPSSAVASTTNTATSTSEQATPKPSTTTATPQTTGTSPTEQSSREVTTPVGGSTVSSVVTQSESAQLAAGVTKTPEPQRLQAAPQDIEAAQQAPPVQQNPPPAPPAEIDRLRSLVLPLANPDAKPGDSGQAAPAANDKVLQWQPDWVQYDRYFRPLIFNPYPEPLRVIYDVAGVPRILLIPPLGRIVTEVRDLGSYNFTALRLNPLGNPVGVAVGNFFGGGYYPGPGLPPPPPPPPVRTLADVPVQVKYTDATYQPIVVRKLVDVGPDPAAGGARKVLLDGVTPAWGEWKQNESGLPQFEVHETQSFPGMEAPAEGPLPGDYDLQLLSDSAPTGLSGKDLTLIIAAAVVAAVGVGAIFLTIFLGRRRRIRH